MMLSVTMPGVIGNYPEALAPVSFVDVLEVLLDLAGRLPLARLLRQVELCLCAIPTIGRAGRLGCAFANAGRSGADRQLAAHDR